jgi:predicted neutral ceramidase superfamily lipid hydrolase
MKGLSFPRAFERRKNFLHLGKFYEEFERYVKTALQTGSALHWGPVGELGGGSFTGTFERKIKYICGFIFFGPRGH